MVKDRQVRRLWKLLAEGKRLARAAAGADMSERSGRKYRDLKRVPSEAAAEHSWRTRPDPFAEVWPEVHGQLQVAPGLQAKTLFAWLQRPHAGKFQNGQWRTFQRGVKAWRATAGPAKEVFFSQKHQPGRLGASDFTHLTSLGVTIAGQPFEHLVYHFVLTYSNSVNSRLIGEWVEVRIYAEHLEVWYGQKEVERLPRLAGRQKQHVNYRHIIDWWVRKPGAFESYRYRDDLFPTSRFRMAFDALHESMGNRASQQYVQILHLAARESESAVDEALRGLLAAERPVTFEAVQQELRRGQPVAPVTEVFVEMTDLARFDDLLMEPRFTDKEVCDDGAGREDGREDDAAGLVAGFALAGVPCELRAVGSSSPAGNAVV